MARTPQIPGAPETNPLTDSEGASAPGATDKSDPAMQLAAKDHEIAQLRAQLAAAQAGGPGPGVFAEAAAPHGRVYRAESKHNDITAAELDKKVRSGEVKLVDHHVLCKDGWYANPMHDREARADLR